MASRLFGLIGFPLGHSFSASYFTEKFDKEKIGAEYRNFPLEKIEDFEALVNRETRLVGLNVTVPYKQKIIPFIDALDQTSRSVGAVNTIFFCREKDRLSLLGYNTDVLGFERSLKEQLQAHHQRALVLGTGGSSKAVAFVLAKLGIEYRMISRSRGEDVLTYDELDPGIIESNTLLVNTSPLGMHPNTDEYPDLPYEGITSEHLLFDLVYNPPLTRFLKLGKERGATVVNGARMLVYQAEASWKIWNRER